MFVARPILLVSMPKELNDFDYGPYLRYTTPNDEGEPVVRLLFISCLDPTTVARSENLETVSHLQ